MSADEFVKWLKDKHWNVVEYETKLNFEVLKREISRYDFVDDTYLNLIASIARGVNETETVWLNCYDEFRDNSDISFKWNEFEIMSLEAAEGDIEWQKDIKNFWDNNLPIIMSVANGYAYYAINTDGKIVFGVEPEFEETQIIANSLNEFLNMIVTNKIIL